MISPVHFTSYNPPFIRSDHLIQTINGIGCLENFTRKTLKPDSCTWDWRWLTSTPLKKQWQGRLCHVLHTCLFHRFESVSNELRQSWNTNVLWSDLHIARKANALVWSRSTFGNIETIEYLKDMKHYCVFSFRCGAVWMTELPRWACTRREVTATRSFDADMWQPNKFISHFE